MEDDGLMECIDQFGVELPTGLFFGLSAQKEIYQVGSKLTIED